MSAKTIPSKTYPFNLHRANVSFATIANILDRCDVPPPHAEAAAWPQIENGSRPRPRSR